MPRRPDDKVEIIKVCPGCSDPNLNVLPPEAGEYCGHFAVAGPLKLKIRMGLPTESTVKCLACQAESTWDLVQTDLQTREIDYVVRS